MRHPAWKMIDAWLPPRQWQLRGLADAPGPKTGVTSRASGMLEQVLGLAAISLSRPISTHPAGAGSAGRVLAPLAGQGPVMGASVSQLCSREGRGIRLASRLVASGTP